jgi:thioredoxin 1
MAGKARSVTERTFTQDVIEASAPVVVDFWAAWCEPCRLIAPVVEELAGAYDGRVKFVKLDVDENPNLAAHYDVMSIPTLGVFVGGKMIGRITGYMPKQDLIQRIESTLNHRIQEG